MAFIDENRFDEQDQNLLNRDQMNQTPGGAATVSAGTSQGSRAGVGAGGTGGWTNIQSYLKANPVNQGSANALKSEVGSQFDNEQSKLQNESSKAISDAKGQVGQFDVNQALNQYGSGDRQGAVQSYNDYINKQYQGPTQFNYGLGGKTQEYGEALSSPAGSQGLMNQIYNKAAGGQMSKGQRALQEQFDVTNPYTAQAQSDMSARYQALKDLANAKTSEAQGEIANAQNQLQTNKQAATSDLNTRSGLLSAQMQDYQRLKDQWNPEKMGGSFEDLYNPIASQYNMIQDFLGLKPVENTVRTAVPKGEITATQPTSYFDGLKGDYINNFDENKYLEDQIAYDTRNMTNQW